MIGYGIKSIAYYLPEEIVTNDYLESVIEGFFCRPKMAGINSRRVSSEK